MLWSEWMESVRKDVECTFGILKARFRILRVGIECHSMEEVDSIFKASCILHNMILKHNNNTIARWENIDWETVNPVISEEEDIVTETIIENDEDDYTNITIQPTSNSQTTTIESASADMRIFFKYFNTKRDILVNTFKTLYSKNKVKWPKNMKSHTREHLLEEMNDVPNAGQQAILRAQIESANSMENIVCENVYVATSVYMNANTLQKFGDGLFAKRVFRKDEKICSFTSHGEIITRVEYERRREQEQKGGYAVVNT